MDANALLDCMLEDMQAAPELYRPTRFWQTGLGSIVEDLRSRGFADFRTHPSALSMYVPSYASRAFRERPERMRRLIGLIETITANRRIGRLLLDDHSGRHQAERHFLVQAAADPGGRPRLDRISESEVGRPAEQFDIDGRRFSRSMLNYLRGLALLKKVAPTSDLGTTLEIGGGYGTLGEILLKSEPDLFYVDVDIPPVAAVASYYLTEVFGEDQVLTYERSRDLAVLDLAELRARYRAVVLCPWQLPQVRGNVDLFVNFLSFQEMEPEVVANYLRHVADLTSRWVLLRNSLRGKQVAVEAGELGVDTPTPTDAVFAMLSGFEVACRDATVFGDTAAGGFASEVSVLRRRGPRA